MPASGTAAEGFIRKRCCGIINDAPMPPAAPLIRPAPGIGPFGKKKAFDRLPCEVIVIWEPIRLCANWRGMNTWPFRTAHVPVIWNFLALAGAARARVRMQAVPTTFIHPKRRS